MFGYQTFIFGLKSLFHKLETTEMKNVRKDKSGNCINRLLDVQQPAWAGANHLQRGQRHRH
jgi:hypothetical protein